MNYIFQFSKENIDLAKQELISLTNPKYYFLIDNLFMINLKPSEIDFLVKRLAYTKNIFRLLFESNTKDILNDVRNCRWGKIFRESFSLRVKGKRELERRLAKEIWAALKSPKVDLKNATTKIFIFFIEEKAYCCLLAREIYQDYNARKPHKRPYFHPTSLNPKMARVLVNLARVKRGDTVLDPFCGTGGILIEAGLIGMRVLGCDISDDMVEGCTRNLIHYGVVNGRIRACDALKLAEFSEKVDAIVTDLPYGRSSYMTDRDKERFYAGFMASAAAALSSGKHLVVVLPASADLPPAPEFDVREKHEVYVHKSLTRRIYVLKRR